MLPMLKVASNRKISRGQVLVVIIFKQQDRRLLFCTSALRNAEAHIQKGSCGRLSSGG